jgi:hypothetical protein
MKKALISPLEPRESGYRVAEVKETSHEMAPPFFWVDCADDVVADFFWYNPADQSIVPTPEPAVTEIRTQGTQTL